ncbi:hypothetical protein T190115A13A_20383 [Tenacibaculum sp. 190524A02b]|uniref:Uncharacterized protein n=1 Tax=Tenacibaculum vairaonense TaxID=3137860 RepID=A0ABM9PN12_9FLAO
MFLNSDRLVGSFKSHLVSKESFIRTRVNTLPCNTIIKK